eukprot:SAG25_NODE_13589_length_265_cov_0.927711_1_plen_47_part_01
MRLNVAKSGINEIGIGLRISGETLLLFIPGPQFPSDWRQMLPQNRVR